MASAEMLTTARSSHREVGRASEREAAFAGRGCARSIQCEEDSNRSFVRRAGLVEGR